MRGGGCVLSLWAASSLAVLHWVGEERVDPCTAHCARVCAPKPSLSYPSYATCQGNARPAHLRPSTLPNPHHTPTANPTEQELRPLPAHHGPRVRWPGQRRAARPGHDARAPGELQTRGVWVGMAGCSSAASCAGGLA